MFHQSFYESKKGPFPLGPYQLTGNRNKPFKFLTDEEAERLAEQDFYWNCQAMFEELEARDPYWTVKSLPFSIAMHLLELKGLDPKLKKVLEEVWGIRKSRH